jgi:hypothetical protein
VAVFVERQLTARKGKKRVTLQLRVFAPTSHGDHSDCSAELRAGTKRIWPATRDLHIGGSDSWQALVLAMRMAALALVLFERDSGMRVDPADWMDIVELLGDMPVPAEMRPRIAEIERAIGEAQRAFRESHEHGDHDAHDHEHGKPRRRPSTAARKPRTVGRKARTASRKR